MNVILTDHSDATCYHRKCRYETEKCELNNVRYNKHIIVVCKELKVAYVQEEREQEDKQV